MQSLSEQFMSIDLAAEYMEDCSIENIEVELEK